MRSVWQDFGCDPALAISVDSSAPIGICSRAGIGKIWHPGARHLWLQENVRDGVIKVVNVAGNVNPVDLTTKHLGAGEICAHFVKLQGFPREGPAALAPEMQFAAPVPASGASPKRRGPEEGCWGQGATKSNE